MEFGVDLDQTAVDLWHGISMRILVTFFTCLICFSQEFWDISESSPRQTLGLSLEKFDTKLHDHSMSFIRAFLFSMQKHDMDFGQVQVMEFPWHLLRKWWNFYRIWAHFRPNCRQRHRHRHEKIPVTFFTLKIRNFESNRHY